MPIVNFSVPATLDKQIINTVKKKGFQSRAEFFRFVAINYINLMNRSSIDEEAKLEYLTRELEDVLSAKLRNKKLQPVEKQLADL